MSFDDLPLIMMEKEVMAEVGAWKNFDELEDYLTLLELVELFNVSNERQSRLMKTIAAAMGADVSGNDEPETSKPRSTVTSDGKLIPGTIESTQDIALVNANFGGNMLGLEVHNYD